MEQIDLLTKDNFGTIILEELGLTNLQTRIYLALVINGPLTVAEISKITNIARQDIYKILPQLLTIGILVKIIETPVKHEAIPLKATITKLFDIRKKENEKLQRKAKDFCKYLSQKNIPKTKLLWIMILK